MRKLLAVVSALFLMLNANSQHSITGRVVSAETNELAYATVKLLAAKDSGVLKATVADGGGNFSFATVASGAYLLRITLLSYADRHINVTVEDKNVELGLLTLDRQAKTLEQVVLTSKRPLFEQKIDRLVINVQDNLTFSGGTAIEVLARSPGVSINNEGQSISLNGSNDILVMMNDKVSKMPVSALVQMLGGLPASSVKRIELISNPGAKYEAGSAGGIINIVLMKGENDGTNGTLSIIAGYGAKERLGITLNMNHRQGKVNVYGNLAVYRTHNEQTYDIRRSIFSGPTRANDTLHSDRETVAGFYSGKIGIDYNPGANTQVGGYVSGFTDPFNLDAVNFSKKELNGTRSFLRIRNEEKNTWSNITSNGYINHKWKKNEINFDLSHLYYSSTNHLFFFNQYLDAQEHVVKTETIQAQKQGPINSVILQLDHTLKIGSRSELQSGLKRSSSYFRNDLSLDSIVNGSAVPNPDLTQLFRLNEDISAAYTSYNTWLGKKTQLALGLRYEYFKLGVNGAAKKLNRTSGDIFPSVFLSKKINDKNTLQASYSKRVSRPAYNDFAPYFTFVDPSTAFTGNENLNQSIIHIVKLDYIFRRYLASFQYRHAGNALVRFQPQVDAIKNTLFYSSVNLDYQDNYSLTFSIPVSFSSKVNMQNNVVLARNIFRTQHLVKNLTVSNNYIEINSSLSISLPHDYSMDITGFFNTPKQTGLSQTRRFGNMNLGAQKKFNKKTSLRFTVTNVLAKGKDWDIVSEPGLDFNLYAEYNYNPTIYRLIYTYNFGSKQAGTTRKKGSGSQDIEGRVR